MSSHKFTILFLVLAALAIVVGKNYFQSDEQKIEALLNDVEGQLEFKQQLKTLEVVKRVRHLEKLVVKELITEIRGDNARRNTGFEDVKAGAAIGATLVHQSEVRRYGSKISVNGARAEVRMGLDVLGGDNANEKFHEVFSVYAELSKVEGDWKFTMISVERLTPDDGH